VLTSGPSVTDTNGLLASANWLGRYNAGTGTDRIGLLQGCC